MVINQIHAIGDILFLEPLFRYFKNKNADKPIVPVRDHLMWITEYIHSAVFIPMSKFKLDYESVKTHNPDYFPARFANQILRNLDKNDHHDFENMMLDKYRLAKLDPFLWKTLDIKFSTHKGMELFNRLRLKSGEYILVNENSQAGTVEINPETNLEVIKMLQIPGYSVVDWFYVMLHAAENHHVSTSTFYVLQAIKNKYEFNSKIVIYPRPNEDGLRGISLLEPTFNYTHGNSNF